MKTSIFRIGFPIGGLNEAAPYNAQPPNTTVKAKNVRAWDVSQGRIRGGQRPGLKKFLSTQLNTTAQIQDLLTVVTTGTATLSLTSLSNRTVAGYGVAGGTIKKFDTTGWTATTAGSGALSSTAPLIFSAEFFGKIYYADGVSAKFVTISTDTAAAWTASAGSLPAASAEKPRLIERWRGRIVQSGIRTDPHNWFMSAVEDATNWNYSPTVITETQAVAGGSSILGKCGDKINSMIPYSDDVLIFLCDHSIVQMSGDPMSGGRMDVITDITGGAYGRPWAIDSQGRIYFVGSRGGVFRMTPGAGMERLTTGLIDERLANVDMNRVIFRLAWSEVEQGLYVYASPLIDQNSFALFFDDATKSWWLDEFTTGTHYPRSIAVYDGDDPEDRTFLLGCGDGYVRQVMRESLNDDGVAIDSYVYLGPIKSPKGGLDTFVLSEVECVLGVQSDDVDYVVYAGDDAENALDDNAGARLLGVLDEDGGYFIIEETPTNQGSYRGTFPAGRSTTKRPRVRGDAMYVKLGNDDLGERWEMEWLQCTLAIPSDAKP